MNLMYAHYFWFTQAIALDEDGKEDEALDIIYNEIDGMLINQEYSKVNNFLNELSPHEYSLNILLGILTITFYCAEHLPNRKDFYNKVAEVVNNSSHSIDILSGLK